MQADPTLAIAQHLTVGLPASSAFPRLFQFGMRAGMRIWATGQAWWQGDEGPYWGHNAVVRIAPFRAHCRLPVLPDGRHILSHDQVEAAVLRGAGWGVRVLPDEDGSLGGESAGAAGIPPPRTALAGRQPAIPAPAAPARTAADGTLAAGPGDPAVRRHAALPAVPARRRDGRRDDGTSPFPAAPALALTAGVALARSTRRSCWATPRWRCRREQRHATAGWHGFAGGAAAEIGFTLLLDAVSAVGKTGAMLRLAFGAHAGWRPQNRHDRGVTWGEAARLLWPQTALGVLVFAGFAIAGWTATLWALPLAGGLLVAIPLCVLTADPRLGRWLRERQIAACPGGRVPPTVGGVRWVSLRATQQPNPVPVPPHVN